MEKTYTWKRIPPPDQVYLIDGVPVTAAEFLAEQERRATEMVGFSKEILGKPWSDHPINQIAKASHKLKDGWSRIGRGERK